MAELSGASGEAINIDFSKSYGAGRGGDRLDRAVRDGGTPAESAIYFNREAADAATLKTADSSKLLALLTKAVGDQWVPMIEKSIHMGTGYDRIEAILNEMATTRYLPQELSTREADTRAQRALAFMNESIADPANVHRRILKNLPPRGIKCVIFICDLFGLEKPADKIAAVYEDVAKREADKKGSATPVSAATPDTEQGRLLKLLRETVDAQWKLMINTSPEMGLGERTMNEALSALSTRFKDDRATAALAFINERTVDPYRTSSVNFTNYAPRGLKCVKKVYDLFGWEMPEGQEALVLADIARRQRMGGSPRPGVR